MLCLVMSGIIRYINNYQNSTLYRCFLSSNRLLIVIFYNENHKFYQKEVTLGDWYNIQGNTNFDLMDLEEILKTCIARKPGYRLSFHVAENTLLLNFVCSEVIKTYKWTIEIPEKIVTDCLQINRTLESYITPRSSYLMPELAPPSGDSKLDAVAHPECSKESDEYSLNDDHGDFAEPKVIAHSKITLPEPKDTDNQNNQLYYISSIHDLKHALIQHCLVSTDILSMLPWVSLLVEKKIVQENKVDGANTVDRSESQDEESSYSSSGEENDKPISTYQTSLHKNLQKNRKNANLDEIQNFKKSLRKTKIASTKK